MTQHTQYWAGVAHTERENKDKYQEVILKGMSGTSSLSKATVVDCCRVTGV